MALNSISIFSTVLYLSLYNLFKLRMLLLEGLKVDFPVPYISIANFGALFCLRLPNRVSLAFLLDVAPSGGCSVLLLFYGEASSEATKLTKGVSSDALKRRISGE